MEPENLNQNEMLVEQKSKLRQVTPLSKYLAMALFIILPFVGGYIGYVFAPDKVVEMEKVVMKENLPIQSVTPPSTAKQLNQPVSEINVPFSTSSIDSEAVSEDVAVEEDETEEKIDKECIDYKKPTCSYGWNTQPTQICPKAAACLYDKLLDSNIIVDIDTKELSTTVIFRCDTVRNAVLAWGDGEEIQPCYSLVETETVELSHKYEALGTYMLSVVKRDSWHDGDDRLVEQKRVELR